MYDIRQHPRTPAECFTPIGFNRKTIGELHTELFNRYDTEQIAESKDLQNIYAHMMILVSVSADIVPPKPIEPRIVELYEKYLDYKFN